MKIRKIVWKIRKGTYMDSLIGYVGRFHAFTIFYRADINKEEINKYI